MKREGGSINIVRLVASWILFLGWVHGSSLSPFQFRPGWKVTDFPNGDKINVWVSSFPSNEEFVVSALDDGNLALIDLGDGGFRAKIKPPQVAVGVGTVLQVAAGRVFAMGQTYDPIAKQGVILDVYDPKTNEWRSLQASALPASAMAVGQVRSR